MKLDRLMGILTLLLQREKVTAPELAERFEVSRRTINRDLEALCQAGIPIVTTQGQGGGITLAEGYRLDHTLLTSAELGAILAGLKGLDSVTQSSATPQLLDKLALSPATYGAASEVIRIDLASHYQDSLSPKIQLIKQAIERRTCLTFMYYAPSGESRRLIEPYHLIFHWSDWYVLGYCLTREDFRLFKLNRLWDVQLAERSFVPRAVPPEKMAFDTFFTPAECTFQGLFAASARYRLIEEYGPESFTVQPDGRLLLSREFRSFEHLLQWVLSFGSQVTVLAPESLREALTKEAQKILKNHGQT